MNPETPKTPREKLEARLTSLLLGELPHDQAAVLHQKLAEDAELAKLYARLKQTVSVVRETLHSPPEQTADQPVPLKLTGERRQKLLEHFKTVAPKEFAEPRRRWAPRLIELAIAASLVAILGALLLPTLSKSKSSVSYFGEERSLSRRQVEILAQQAAQSPSAMRASHGGGTLAYPKVPLPQAAPAGFPPQSISAPIEGKPDNGPTAPPAPPAKANLATIVLPQDKEHAALTASTLFDSAPGQQTDFFWQNSSAEGRLAGEAGAVTANDAAAFRNHFNLNLNGHADSLSEVAQGVQMASTLEKKSPAAGTTLSPQVAEPAIAAEAYKRQYGGPTPVASAEKPADELARSEAQVPVLGDMPSAGRFFRSTSESSGNRIDGASKPSVEVGFPITTAGTVEFGLFPTSPTVAPPEPSSSSASYYSKGGFGGYASVQPAATSGVEQRLTTATNSVALNWFPAPAVLNASSGLLLAAGGATGVGSSGALSAEQLHAPTLARQLAEVTKSSELPGIGAAGQRGYFNDSGEWNLGTKKEEMGKILSSSAAANPPAGPASVAAQTQAEEPKMTASSRPYFEAKAELEELKRFREILDMKIASEKIDADLPKTAMVEIVNKAVPATKDSSTLWDTIRGDNSRKFESSARVKVERDQSDIASLAEHEQTTGYDPYFVQTEYETIQSERILGKAATNLNLNEVWAKKQAGKPLTTAETIERLKKSLDLRSVPNSSLLEIGARSDNADEAARIANAVAEAYQEDRREQRAKLTKDGIATLEERFAEQDTKIRDAQKKVDALRAQLQTTEAAPSADGSAVRQPDSTLPKPAAPAPIPQPEIQTCDNSFSTFSLNVSDVSFKLAAASLEKGLMPEPATVRSEEFINAFDYRDPEPPPSVPVAFAYERARYPFAQNRDLLRFSLKTAALGRQPGRPLNIVLLLDNSGSMERADRVRIIQEALRVLASQLQPQDKFSVVTFARTPRLWVDGVAGNEAAQAAAEVGSLTPQGGTNLEDAMNLAYQTALRHYLANGVNRVVLLTDGAANLGNVDPEALKQKVEAHRKQGVALDCFGIGWEGYNDDLLEILSRNGDGRYGFINAPEEAAVEFAGQLAGALHVAASDVKVQVEFNPARVSAWRQIGYAKHQLTKEQFRDNTVDAAEIGAAESGNALYVVQVNPRGDGPLATVRVRYKVPGTTDYHEHEWPVPYNGNAVAMEQATPAMRLAATGSAFSEWLVSSPYATEVSPDRLLGYLTGVPELYGADTRPKKLEWMIRQAKSITGK
jgi:Mg-chelatase subunit ChlD